MLCAKPIHVGEGRSFGCGQCLNCTINKRRAWTARILLEGKATEAAGQEVSWVTLTYAPENLPFQSRGTGVPVATLEPRDYVRCFKRMRKSSNDGGVGGFRYCLVGEYGDETLRPHYHALVFGPPVYRVERFLQRTWEQELGHTRTRPWATPDPSRGEQAAESLKMIRAAYCAHYVTKKMNVVDSPKLRPEQHPEFWRSSRNPGLGCTQYLLRLQTTKGGAIDLAETGDVMRTVRIGGKIWPVHQKVRSWLREQLDVPGLLAEREAVLPAVRERNVPTSDDYLTAAAQCVKLERRAALKRKEL